ncbi:hypothetical protein VTN02DRAFT_4778 [Thermoascus thermophilus]
MDHRRDHYYHPSSHDIHPYPISHSALLEGPFIPPTEAAVLVPTGVALAADSARYYDLYSAVDSWMASGFFSPWPEPMPVPMLNGAAPWGLGVTEDCTFDLSPVSKVLAPEGSSYRPFSVVDGDNNCVDSPSSTDSFPDPSRPSGARDMFSSPPFVEDHGRRMAFPRGSPQQEPERERPGTSIGPSSPARSIASSHQSAPAKRRSPGDGDDVEACCGGDPDDDGSNDPPYSLLIYQALISAPGMKLPLQGIYSWFEKNTTKGKDQNSKGWQNSIRHNLSMNAGFEAVREESPTGKRPVNFWRLTDEAIAKGVQSTTRYRKQGNHRKAVKSENPAPQRQRSGAKGGRAAKVAARIRRANHDEPQSERRQRPRDGLPRRRPYRSRFSAAAAAAAANVHASISIPIACATGSPAESFFDLGSVVGCPETPSGSPILFYADAEAEPEGLPLVFGSSLDGRGPLFHP